VMGARNVASSSKASARHQSDRDEVSLKLNALNAQNNAAEHAMLSLGQARAVISAARCALA
jgi:hypothetical protein